MKISWNEEKNKLLQETRNVSFEQIEGKIYSGDFILVEHYQKERKNQFIIFVKIDNYINAVPCLVSAKEVFLKTIYESRKYNKKYNKYLK